MPFIRATSHFPEPGTEQVLWECQRMDRQTDAHRETHKDPHPSQYPSLHLSAAAHPLLDPKISSSWRPSGAKLPPHITDPAAAKRPALCSPGPSCPHSCLLPRLPHPPPGPYCPATLSCPPSQDTPATSHLCARAAGPCPGMSVLSLPYSAKSCSSFKARQKSWGLLPRHPGAQGPFLHLCMAFSLTRREALEDRIPISGTRTPSTWHCSGQSLCQVSVASSAPSTQRCCPICAKLQLCLALLDFNNGRHSLQLHLPGTPMTTCHEAPMPADHSQAPAAALTLCRGISLLPLLLWEILLSLLPF